MDKKWVFLDRRSDEYISGLQAFINRSLEISPFVDKIKCPCKECKNRYYKTTMVVEEHMHDIGMWNRYVNMPWLSHGEQLPHSSTLDMAGPSGTHHPMPDHDMPDMLEDAFGIHSDNNMPESSTQPIDDHDSGPTPDARKFYELLRDADTDLFPGARIKKLDFIVRLYKIKCLHNNSDVSFSETLNLLKESFPEGETLPNSFYKTKKMIKDIGLSYEKIDACPNDCMLYWKEHKNDECCNVCGISRWKQNKLGNDATVRGKKKPAKILRYFPLGPRLQRLYMSRHTAESMAWHSDKRPKDGQLRHPADSPAWAKLDDKYPNFGHEYRNVWLGLASDGFNPFAIMSSSHSTWPVVLSVYNLPPWLCMKQPYLILSLLIPGPKGPGNNIDVYLQPLVEELKMLWTEGLQTYDAFNKEVFTMRAAVLWTINDFPAYAMLSGYSTKGKKACPVCAEDTESIRLQNGKKESFMGHRRWLPIDHYYRGWRNNFNGFPERRTRPKPKTGSEILRSLHGLKVQFGKGNNKKNKPRKRKRATQDPPELDYGNWRKKSIFFELPYWEHLLLRHNLDVMHIEKNVTDSVVGTLLGIDGKNKDSVNARKDMVLLNVKHGLHPTEGSNGPKYPPASFNLLNGEKTTMCEVLSNVQPPDGWSSNIKNCVRVEERKLVGLKSHDCHILMQHLLPIAIRRPIRCKKLIKVLLELSGFFRQLCTKVGSAKYFENLSKKIALTLCDLENIMPPAFFDIMEHLPIHLADEAALAGPVQYRWMYPIERYLHTLKEYVRNKSNPEGSIAEGYLIDECLSFCSMYLSDKTESKRTKLGRNADDPTNTIRPGLPLFVKKGRALERPQKVKLTDEERNRAHTHVLINCPEISHHLKQHVEIEKRKRGRRSVQDSEKMANLSFHEYFKDLIEEKINQGEDIDPDIRALANRPNNEVKRFKKYIMNGYRFHIKSLDTESNAQNSGIFVNAGSNCYATANDHRPRDAMLDYYGVLLDIIELDYYNDRKVLLFEADWADGKVPNRGVKKDEFGFILVNFNHLLPPPDTFIFASQALQVFYMQDPVETDWKVVVTTKPRDFFDMGINLDPEPYVPQLITHVSNDEEDVTIARTDMASVNLD